MGAWAHSANASGQRHLLVDHLEATAELTGGFAARFGAGELGYLTGLWHDLGKFSCDWQAYLLAAEAGRPARYSPGHKAAGAKLAAEHQLTPAAFAIHGHHGGLTDVATIKDCASTTDAAREESLRAARAAGITLDCPPARALLPATVVADPLALELFTRLLFSALVDADSLDTARHHGAVELPPPPTPDTLQERFTQRADALVGGKAGTRTGRMSGVRAAIRAACEERAADPPGLFRLAAPTGSGKTIAALSFALGHARAHGLDRVVVALPFTSITQQSAAVYRALLDEPEHDGRPVVLEHHSMLGDLPDEEWNRHAAENWDAPVVVTTTVQLFESLFSRTRSATRKLHRLAGAVLVLDEVQALPHHLLVPILHGLRQLVEGYGVTVVLASATQPEWWSIREFEDLSVTDLVDSELRRDAAFRRVAFVWERPLGWDEVAGRLADEAQVLAIVNTTRDAATLAAAVRDRSEVLHLSTRMCPAHRRHVLSDLQPRLADGRACRVVSTQLVEAGVDLDFPVVWRAMGPADSLLQAAGRANREGRATQGRVVLFEPTEGRLPPGGYRLATDQARQLFGPNRADPDDEEVLARYYRELYVLLRVGDDPEHVQEARRHLDYRQTAARFRMIPDDTVAVVVAGVVEEEWEWCGPDLVRARRVLAALRRREPLLGPGPLRVLQPFTVDLLPGALRGIAGLTSELVPGVLEWHGRYDPLLGLVVEPSSEVMVL